MKSARLRDLPPVAAALSFERVVVMLISTGFSLLCGGIWHLPFRKERRYLKPWQVEQSSGLGHLQVPGEACARPAERALGGGCVAGPHPISDGSCAPSQPRGCPRQRGPVCRLCRAWEQQGEGGSLQRGGLE